MLSRTHRFHGLGSVRPTLRRGQTMRGEGFRIKYHPSSHPHSRFAVIVSKKVDKRAVVRNRIRRRIYVCIKELLTDIKQPHDVVISIYDKRLADRDWTKLTQEVQRAFKRANIVS